MPILSEGYLETIRISMMELFTKIVNCFYLLIFSQKNPSQMFDWILNTPLFRTNVQSRLIE